MIRGILADGIYETCPTHGPQVFMANRQIEVKDNIVRLVNDDKNFTWHLSHFFDVNNIWDKEAGKSHSVQDHKNYTFSE